MIFATLGVAGPLAAGWALWSLASRGGADPYDSRLYWLGALAVGFLAGVAAADSRVALAVPLPLIAYPFVNTFELAERTHSPFGPIGVVFLLFFAPVLAGATLGGAAVARAFGGVHR